MKFLLIYPFIIVLFQHQPSFQRGASQVVLVVKEPVCQCRRHKRLGFDPWVGKILWSRKWQPTPVFLPGESQGQRSLVGYSPWHFHFPHSEAPQIDICYFHIQTCSLNFQLNSQLGCLPSTQNLYCYIYYLSPKPTSLVGLSISPTPSVGSIISQLPAKEILESNIYFFFNWFFTYLYNFLMGSSFKTFFSRKALD